MVCVKIAVVTSAAAAQSTKANVRLAYSELKAPIDGQVDVRAVRAGMPVRPSSATRRWLESPIVAWAVLTCMTNAGGVTTIGGTLNSTFATIATLIPPG